MTRVVFVTDPLARFNPKKDSTMAMILAAQKRGWQVAVLELNDLSVIAGIAYGRVRSIQVDFAAEPWYCLGEAETLPLSAFSVILMRKDPPFDMEYIYATYILELAEAAGTLVVNKPQSLRDANEKMFINHFPQSITDTLVTRDKTQIREFLAQHQDIILKPLDGMGGVSIFRVGRSDPNFNVIVETLTQSGSRYVMVQRYLPEVKQGDKRILLIDGEPIPYGLARIPASGETRANLAAGGTGLGQALSEREYWLCEQVKPVLRAKGLLFVGLDVIGGFITEINVTSPTCIRELDSEFKLDIAGGLMDCIAAKLMDNRR